MLSKSSKWELGLVHYIAKFTILRIIISRFECIDIYKFSLLCGLVFPGEKKLIVLILLPHSWQLTETQ